MANEPAGTGRSGVSRDRLLGGRAVLYQPVDGYRVAIDPVLLAAACPAEPGQSVAELGCGTAAALICLATRVPRLDLLGIDRDAGALDLARRSVAANGLSARCRLVLSDLADLPVDHPRVDHVLMNPPFLEDGEGTRSPQAWRDRAHHGGDLAGWIAAAGRLLKPKGWITAIHRADRFDRLVSLLGRRFGALTLIALLPREGRGASRVIIRARAGVRTPARITAPLVLHRADGRYTEAADRVLQGGAGLDDVL